LLLGGKTALMDDGVVTQFGTTADIYRQPGNLTAAQVFSDPPINSAEIVKSGQTVRLKTGVSWDLSGEAANLSDGTYTVAVRPHHVTPIAKSASDVAINGTVLVTELSGSESSAHFQMGEYGWVSLSHGVHSYQIGKEHGFFMDVSKCFYFGSDGRFVA
jgi:glycerol transport system ATP-binding protein